VKKLREYAVNEGHNVDQLIIHQKDYKELCDSITSPDAPKLFIFSIPHGGVGDEAVKGLRPYLKSGDIILDCSNDIGEIQNVDRTISTRKEYTTLVAA
jgi:6-phosphogluconate dehydrogenase